MNDGILKTTLKIQSPPQLTQHRQNDATPKEEHLIIPLHHSISVSLFRKSMGNKFSCFANANEGTTGPQKERGFCSGHIRSLSLSLQICSWVNYHLLGLMKRNALIFELLMCCKYTALTTHN